MEGGERIGTVLSILLLILKILGITLLVLLGLVLLILILVLCVPIRYDIRGRYDEKLKAKAGVSWLLKLVHVKLEAIQAQIRVRVCVFGHAFKKMYLGNWGDNAPEEKKQEFSGNDETDPESAGIPAEDDDEDDEDDELLLLTEKNAEEEAGKPDVKSAEAKKKTKTEEKKAKARPTPKEKYDELFAQLQQREEEKERAREQEKAREKAKAAGKEQEAESEPLSEEEESFLIKAADWVDKISDFWDDEKNQNAVWLIEKQLAKLGRHLLPTGFLLKGDLGLGDPAKTGKIIGTVYRFYPLFGEHIQLNGIFDEKRTDVYLGLKGRIRLGILVEIAVRLFLNGRIRKWLFAYLKKNKEKGKDEEKQRQPEAKAA